jgi:serine/threonine protein kinase
MATSELKTIGPYEIRGVLGRGGMATVYRAYQASLDREVAVKVMANQFADDPTFMERFRREARSIAKLDHPNILAVYDFGQDGNVPYIVTQLLEGKTLRERLGHPLDPRVAAKINSQIGAALEYAHERGLVHRDVKPSNVLMDKRDRAVLSDFGIVKLMQSDSNLTATGLGVGTPEYMSPEQGMGEGLDGRSDLYSLGVMLYEMLTGVTPFRADTPLAVMMGHVNKPLPDPMQYNPHLTPQMVQVLRIALAKRPDERYPTVNDFVDAFNHAVYSSGLPPLPSSTGPGVQGIVPGAALGTGTQQAVGPKPGFSDPNSTRMAGPGTPLAVQPATGPNLPPLPLGQVPAAYGPPPVTGPHTPPNTGPLPQPITGPHTPPHVPVSDTGPGRNFNYAPNESTRIASKNNPSTGPRPPYTPPPGPLTPPPGYQFNQPFAGQPQPSVQQPATPPPGNLAGVGYAPFNAQANNYSSSQPATPPTGSQPVPVQPPPRKKGGLPLALIGGLVAALVIIAVVVIVLTSGKPTGPTAGSTITPAVPTSTVAPTATPATTAAATTSAPTAAPTTALVATAPVVIEPTATIAPTTAPTATAAPTTGPATTAGPSLVVLNVGTSRRGDTEIAQPEDVTTEFTAGQEVFVYIHADQGRPDVDSVEITLIKDGVPQPPKTEAIGKVSGFNFFSLDKPAVGYYKLEVRYNGNLVGKQPEFKVDAPPTAPPAQQTQAPQTQPPVQQTKAPQTQPPVQKTQAPPPKTTVAPPPKTTAPQPTACLPGKC